MSPNVRGFAKFPGADIPQRVAGSGNLGEEPHIR
jgi:hypothetical protein